MSEAVSDFIAFMESKGHAPARVDDIKSDDQKRYIQAAGDRANTKKLQYILKNDGEFVVGGFVHYREGEWHTYVGKTGGKAGKLDASERDAIRKKREAERRAAEDARAQSHRDVRLATRVVLETAKYAEPDHPYLARKKIRPHNFKQHAGKLIIPIWADRKLSWYQTIEPDGEKYFGSGSFGDPTCSGGKVQGGYCPLWDKESGMDYILFAEGVATGATLHEVTGLPTMVCFTAGNLKAVAEQFRGAYPQAKFIICADNDQWTPIHKYVRTVIPEDWRGIPGDDPRWQEWRAANMLVNTGVLKAQEVCVTDICARMVTPPIPVDDYDKATDFNDYFIKEGEEKLRAYLDLELARPMPKIPKPEEKPLLPPPDSFSDKVDWQEQLIVRGVDKNGIPSYAENSVNYKLMVCNHPRLRHVFAYDEFHLCTMVVAPGPWVEDLGQDFQVHPLNQSDERNVDYFLQKSFGLRGSLEKVSGSIDECALINRFHPARDHLQTLVWDGVGRLDDWIIKYCRATRDDPDYVRCVGRKWLIAAVKRLMEPGCQFDNMLILEGPQDAGKSRTFRTLSRFGPRDSYHEYFMDTFNIAEADDKDELMKLTGVVIVEIQEMSGFNKRDDDALKKFISTRHDTFRAPYGRRPDKWPRQFVLGGTYNPRDGIFKDSTGLKRYWPVTIGEVDLGGLERDREQLWAEAYYRYRQGEDLVLPVEIVEKAKKAADERRIHHVMTEDVLRQVEGRRFFTTRDVLQGMGVALRLDQKTQQEVFTVNEILRAQGFKPARKRAGTSQIRGWVPSGSFLKDGLEFREDYYGEEELKF